MTPFTEFEQISIVYVAASNTLDIIKHEYFRYLLWYPIMFVKGYSVAHELGMVVL